MPVDNIIQEDRRLVMLRTALELGGNANESILHDSLSAYGHTLTRDTVLTEIHWLAEQGLFTSKQLPGCLVVTLTGRGFDAAAGRGKFHGVKRPRPGERA